MNINKPSGTSPDKYSSDPSSSQKSAPLEGGKIEFAALKSLAQTASSTAIDSTLKENEIKVAKDSACASIFGYVTYAFNQASSIARDFVSSLVLPSPNHYDKKIALLQEDLFIKTGAHIAAESAKVMAKRQIHKFRYFLSNTDLLTAKEAQSGSLKQFLSINDDGKITLSLKGYAFLNILNGHASLLLEKTFEVNILRALSNGIHFLHDLQKAKPFLLVEIVQDTLKELVGDKSVPLSDTSDANEQHDRFMAKLQHSLTKALFPHGADDIDIPLPLQSILSQKAFLEIQKKALPRKMAIVYDKATSEVTKYKLLAKAVQELKNILTDEPEIKAASGETKIAPYPHQKEFNKHLTAAVSLFIDQIDSTLLSVLKPIINNKVRAQGPKIVQKLATLDLNTFLNKTLKASCKKLSPEGEWKTQDGKDVFIFKPLDPKTRTQREALDQQALADNKKEIAKSIDTMADDLNGLISRVSRLKRDSSLRLSKIKEALIVIHLNIRKALIRFVFKLFRMDKQISTLSQQIISMIEKIDVDKAASPLKKVILRTRLKT